MAHFSRIRAIGLWLLNSVWQPAEAEQADTNIAASVNGDGGGTWAPTSTIVFGGQGFSVGVHGVSSAPMKGWWTVATTVQIDGAGGLSFGADAAHPVPFGGYLTGTPQQLIYSGGPPIFTTGLVVGQSAAGDLILDGTAGHNARLIVQGANGSATFAATTAWFLSTALAQITSTGVLTVNDGGSISVGSGGAGASVVIQAASVVTVVNGGFLNVAGKLNIGGTGAIELANGSGATFDSGATLVMAAGSVTSDASARTRSGKETLSGAGARTAHRRSGAGFGAQTVDVSADIWLIPPTPGVDGIYTLRSTSAPIPTQGEVITCVRHGASDAHTALFRREDGTTLLAFAISTTHTVSADFEFDGVNWWPLRFSGTVGTEIQTIA